MDVRDFTYVLSIVRYGSITKAAEKLFISQPSLSIYIQNLEKKLGFPLFDRIGRKLIPTSEGKIYIKYARQITDLDSQLEQEFNDLKNYNKGTISIGITITKGSFLLPQIYPHLNKKCPNISIRFIEDSSENLEDKVLKREIDIILVNYPFRKHDLHYESLFKERFLIAIPPNSKINSKIENDKIDIQKLKNENFILAEKGQKIREFSDYLFIKNNIRPKILMETCNITTSFKLTQAGIGISFILDTYSNYLLENKKDVKLYSIKNISDSDNLYVIAYPKDCFISNTTEKVISILKSLLPFS